MDLRSFRENSPESYDLFVQVLQRQLGNLARHGAFSQLNHSGKVTYLLIDRYSEEAEVGGIEYYGKTLKMSVESLERALESEATSFPRIVQSFLKRLALDLLLLPNVKDEEIALLLGCESVSLFSSLFQDWTGNSPTEYRASNSSEPNNLGIGLPSLSPKKSVIETSSKKLGKINSPTLLIYDRIAKEYFGNDDGSFSYKVNTLLIKQLREGTHGIEVVADHLSMSVRSLQMKLKSEGTSYQKILNSLRKNLAITYLDEKSVTKAQIARMLGFSEISIFTRTFQKWTGLTPSEYQQSRLRDSQGDNRHKQPPPTPQEQIDPKNPLPLPSEEGSPKEWQPAPALPPNEIDTSQEADLDNQEVSILKEEEITLSEGASKLQGGDAVSSIEETSGNQSSTPTILVIDDEEGIRNSLQDLLEFEDYEVLTAHNGKVGLDTLLKEEVDVAICDIKMPVMNGMEVLVKAAKAKPETPFIMISAHGDIETAVEATKLGAYDFFEKPPDLNRLLLTVKNAIERKNLVIKPNDSNLPGYTTRSILGNSPLLLEYKEKVERLAYTDFSVLLTGESGTGKTLSAGWIHEKSNRAGGPMIVVNCATIPSELIESELFGHEKGSFTGAYKQRIGKFQQANGGTIFLDEIGNLSLSAQAKILQVIESKQITRIGSDKIVNLDVRILYATHLNLLHAIREGKFREDLFYRISAVDIEVPPLRKRREDIPTLVRAFLEELCIQVGHSEVSIEDEAVILFRDTSYPFPGNVRELKNMLVGLLAFGGGKVRKQEVSAMLLRKEKNLRKSTDAMPSINQVITKLNSKDIGESHQTSNRNKENPDWYGAFLEAHAHDIKNHLNVIAHWNQRLKKEIQKNGMAKLPKEVQEPLETISKRTAQAKHKFFLLRNINGINRIVKKKVALLDIISRTVEVYRGPNVEIENLTHNDGNFHILGDKVLLESILGNLLENAIQAIEIKGGGDKGKIQVSCDMGSEPGTPSATLKISDTGCGINQSILANIYDLGFSTKPEEGHGFGLYFVNIAVAFLDGNIRIESDLNVGTDVFLELPLYRKE